FPISPARPGREGDQMRPPTLRRARLACALSLTAIVALSLAPPARGATGSAFVRVNQVGYPSSASKRAYLMSSADESGATFAVKSGATTAFSESIGANLGSWSNAYPNIYALDFSSVSSTGTY